MKDMDLKGTLSHFFQEKAERFDIRAAFLYGSFARGFPHPDSDLDIAIVFDDDSDEDIIYRQIMDISLLLLEKSGRDVNVIPIYRDFRKPFLYYNAIVLGTSVYIRDISELTYLKQEALFQMEDFSIFGLEWQLKMAKKNLEVIRHA
jgi:predicted nucleotidyltransferase